MPEFNPREYREGKIFESKDVRGFEDQPGMEKVDDEEVLRYLGENPHVEYIRELRAQGRYWREIAAILNVALTNRLRKLERKEFDEGEEEENVREQINALHEAVRVVDGAIQATGTKVYGTLNKVENGPSNEARMFEQIRELVESGNKLAGEVLQKMEESFRKGDSAQRVRSDMDKRMSEYVEEYKRKFGLTRVLDDEREVRAVLNRWLPLNPD